MDISFNCVRIRLFLRERKKMATSRYRQSSRNLCMVTIWWTDVFEKSFHDRFVICAIIVVGFRCERSKRSVFVCAPHKMYRPMKCQHYTTSHDHLFDFAIINSLFFVIVCNLKLDTTQFNAKSQSKVNQKNEISRNDKIAKANRYAYSVGYEIKSVFLLTHLKKTNRKKIQPKFITFSLLSSLAPSSVLSVHFLKTHSAPSVCPMSLDY